MADLEKYSEQIFEDVKHIDENGIEYWYARELQEVLEYKEWRNFLKVIDKAKEACENAGNIVSNHFVDINKMINLGKGAARYIDDYKLTRYACYLIVMNGNPRKKVIALGQTYFAVQTRKQEVEDFQNLSEDLRRIRLRADVKGFNKKLAATAQNAGVENFGKFQNYGYRGLYNGETAADIKRRKNLKQNQDILDHMGSTELAANYFRITQTEEKLRKENIQGEDKANNAHYKVGKIVRKTIKEIGGTMPEDLPTPEKSIKELNKEYKNKELPQ